ncbi:GNAT family N-acetyltransferase [Streptomyces sp. NPDC093111]|uniref:GNAT family N-acetyltransferase n=1 Tax=Streptomyces sp. NPDC093111 TaxID=3154978 RepID=UPI00343D40E9
MNATALLRADASPSAPPLVLRPWSMADVAALVEAYRDPAMRRWITTVVDDEADAERWVETQEAGWASGTRFSFAVLEAGAGEDPGRLVGNVALKGVAAGKPTAEVGYWTAAPARGRGVAQRALEAVTDWAFRTFGDAGLDTLELLHQVDNEASCRVAEKSGYPLDRLLSATPPAFPRDGHLHVRHRKV